MEKKVNKYYLITLLIFILILIVAINSAHFFKNTN